MLELRLVHSKLARLKIKNGKVQVSISIDKLVLGTDKRHAGVPFSKIDAKNRLSVACAVTQICVPNVVTCDKEPL